MPKIGCDHNCLAVITLDSVLSKIKSVICNFFKRMKIHLNKKRKIIRHISEEE